MQKVTIALVVVLPMVSGGCAGLSQTEQRTLTGGAAGAAGGAVIGATDGNAGLGAAIGAGTGLLGGFLYGQHETSKQDASQKGVTDGYN